MSEKLKPCPFCGSHILHQYLDGYNPGNDYWILCAECESSCGMRDSKLEAIEAWNTRALPYKGMPLLKNIPSEFHGYKVDELLKVIQFAKQHGYDIESKGMGIEKICDNCGFIPCKCTGSKGMVVKESIEEGKNSYCDCHKCAPKEGSEQSFCNNSSEQPINVPSCIPTPKEGSSAQKCKEEILNLFSLHVIGGLTLNGLECAVQDIFAKLSSKSELVPLDDKEMLLIIKSKIKNPAVYAIARNQLRQGIKAICAHFGTPKTKEGG